jgi:hypothetical protein
VILRLHSMRPIFVAVALAGCLPAWAADDLGRLFFTPQERRQLDQLRLAPAAEQTASRVTVNGVVQSSTGRSVVWVNGAPHVPASQGGSGVVLSAGNGTATVATEPGKPPLRIKVGETATFLPGPGPGSQ